MRVLIIDDDEDLHTLLSHYVASQWADAVIDHYDPKLQAIPGPEFPLGSYDVLVLDYMLGREDGDASSGSPSSRAAPIARRSCS